ncbi:hypothetical protein [Noviherbaspirillum sp.]|uniref:hypothetical protein n=1 Tax=Noviherbaspirillum sp. TaxID=1926288 RepID=UPI002B49F261|nr:hypothetical protein [Noviherbaspirillum sp.]
MFPDSPADGAGSCGSDREWRLVIHYSLDGGKKFDYFRSWFLSTDLKEAFEKSKHITVTLKGNQMFLGNDIYAFSHDLHKGMTGAGNVVEGGPKLYPTLKHLPARITSLATTTFDRKKSQSKDDVPFHSLQFRRRNIARPSRPSAHRVTSSR